MEIDPVTASEFVRAKMAAGSEVVPIFWISVAGDREEYVAEVRRLCRGSPIVAVVLRDSGFDDPNVVLQDVMRMCERNREHFVRQDIAQEAAIQGRLGILIVARRELGIPQLSSPVQLPAWFPVAASLIVSSSITDISWIADVALDHPAARCGEIREELCGLEGALLRRLRATKTANHNRTSRLWAKIGRPDEGLEEFLAEAERAHSLVGIPSGFRPSRKGFVSVVSRLWNGFLTSTADEMPQLGLALAEAMQFKGDGLLPCYRSVQALLGRPSNSIKADALWGLEVTIVVGSACQFVTAAAHAADYPRFPLALVRSISTDLRQGLRAAQSALD